MDPATTFSLACGTLQVIGFGIQTAKAFHEIHKSSTSTPADHERFEEEAVQLGKASSSLSALLNDLQAVEGKLNRDQKQLRNIARECDDAVHDMTNKLDGLKISGPGRKRDVTGQWVKIVRERSNIDIIKKTLESKQQLLNTQMLVNIRQVQNFFDHLTLSSTPVDLRNVFPKIRLSTVTFPKVLARWPLRLSRSLEPKQLVRNLLRSASVLAERCITIVEGL